MFSHRTESRQKLLWLREPIEVTIVKRLMLFVSLVDYLSFWVWEKFVLMLPPTLHYNSLDTVLYAHNILRFIGSFYWKVCVLYILKIYNKKYSLYKYICKYLMLWPCKAVDRWSYEIKPKYWKLDNSYIYITEHIILFGAFWLSKI